MSYYYRELVERLRKPSNWLRQGFGAWKDVTSEYDGAPFEAADAIERLTRERNSALSYADHATEAERERCARICERMGYEVPWASGSAYGPQCAAAIRKG